MVFRSPWKHQRCGKAMVKAEKKRSRTQVKHTGETGDQQTMKCKQSVNRQHDGLSSCLAPDFQDTTARSSHQLGWASAAIVALLPCHSTERHVLVLPPVFVETWSASDETSVKEWIPLLFWLFPGTRGLIFRLYFPVGVLECSAEANFRQRGVIKACTYETISVKCEWCSFIFVVVL